MWKRARSSLSFRGEEAGREEEEGEAEGREGMVKPRMVLWVCGCVGVCL
jgi:hypothetical protein